MLSYQHIYHAGNMADVHKHLWLLTVLEYLRRKDKPYVWIDTHGGRGLYNLHSNEAQKIKEFEDGIKAVEDDIQASSHPVLQIYQEMLDGVNKGSDEIKYYTGSVYLAAQMLRGNDRLYAYELHPAEFEFLARNLQDFKAVKVQKENGYQGLKSLMPPQIRRGGALVDPSYEVKDEYARVVAAISEAYKKWQQGVFMVWYPILAAARHEDMCAGLAALSPEFIRDEWMFDGVEKGMLGSGMFILNPPYRSGAVMDDIKSKLLIMN